MSGPKIVDIRLIQAIQDRQRRLARQRLQQLQKQWMMKRERIKASLDAVKVMSDGDDIKGIEQSISAMDQRLAHFSDDQSLDELVQRGAEQLAFMDAELSRLQQQISDALSEVHQRARSMQAAVEDVAARLQSVGLEQERQQLLSAPSLTALERAGLLLVSHKQEQGEQAIKEALADLGVNATPRQFKPKANDPDHERIEQLLLELELLDDGSTTGEIRARLEGLNREPDPRQRRLHLDSLALQISEILQRSRESIARQAVLDELEAQLGVYDNVPADLVKAINTKREGVSQEGPSLDDLREAVEHWCQQESRRLDGERIRNVVLGSLRELGYDVREGMMTGWVEGGSVILQKPGSRDYAVELQDLNGRFRSRVVRYGDPNAPVSDQQRQRDTEIEQQWCSAHADALERIRQQGMQATMMAHREPGDVPLAVIKLSKEEQRNRDSAVNPQQNARAES